MPLIVENKFAFIAHPRTASMSTARAIVRNLGGYKWSGHHSSMEGFPREKPPIILTTIRNPFDVVATWWQLTCADKSWADLGFEHFLRKWDHKPHVLFGQPLHYMANQCTHFMWYETLQKHWDYYMELMDLPKNEIPVTNKTPNKKPWPDYYDTPEIKRLAMERFGREAKKWGYPCL